MQKLKPEYMLTILEQLKQGKSEKEIALATKRHRTTVSRYVNYLRKNYAYDFTLLTNEIIDELHQRLPDMMDRDLIIFLSKLIPQKAEVKTEHTETQRVLHLHLWKPEQNAES